MCGRFTITVTKKDLEDYIKEKYDIEGINFDTNIPNYNVSPGTEIISIIHNQDYHIGLLKWGFKTRYFNQPLINIKVETLFSKTMFKNFINRRCVFLADSFYEWRKTDKQPMLIKTENQLFAMAGIYNTYQDELGNNLYTAAILTTNSNKCLEGIHDRMPVILNEEQSKQWLRNPSKDLLVPYLERLEIYPVSKMVNNSKNNDLALVKKIDLR